MGMGVGRRIGGAIGGFARRLAMQALISSIVMTGIGTASRDDFALPRAALAFLGFDASNGSATAAKPTGDAGKSARLAYSPAGRGTLPPPEDAASRTAAAAPKAVVLPARTGRAAERPVLLFTQCAPACESRDPLIFAAALPMTPPRPAIPAEPPIPPASSPPLVSEATPAVPAGDELPPPAALTARGAMDETLVETTVALPGRAFGAAAQLVGWGG